MSIAHAPASSETIVTDSQDIGELAATICLPLRDALSPSARRKAEWAVQAGLERKFGAALAQARKYVEESVELACIQLELGRHMTDCGGCAMPEFRCLAAADMERREDDLLTRLAGGFR